MGFESQFLVLGSGIAGLTFALRVADHGSVIVVTKKAPTESATNYAQGGIAAVFDDSDSFDSHLGDTLRAGAGLCREDVAKFVIERGPSAVQGLIDLGVRFDQAGQGHYDLGREGGHSHRRVLHTSDLTGQEIERVLVQRCEAHPSIRVMPNAIAVDLVTSEKFGRTAPYRVEGAYVLDETTGEVSTFLSPIVLLATGGCGKVYVYTSNPDIASGDGVAMAYRAGATVANMEFYQFHPTCLYHPEARSFLISEAVRGEGALLRNKSGERFMPDYDVRAELAPRDIVARAIDFELKRSGDDCVFLDCTSMDQDFLQSRFPGISHRCSSHGFDISRQQIPVVPAAHYVCGGVRTDIHGETDIQNLFAAGEVSCTGLHGANRLASNSLLEGVVFAHAAADTAIQRMKKDVSGMEGLPPWDPGSAEDPTEAVLVNANWDEIRQMMWHYVGIVRGDKRLMRARRRIKTLQQEIREYYWDFRVTPALVELRNLATVAQLIIESAAGRKESRGLHFTVDYPETGPIGNDTLLKRSDFES